MRGPPVRIERHVKHGFFSGTARIEDEMIGRWRQPVTDPCRDRLELGASGEHEQCLDHLILYDQATLAKEFDVFATWFVKELLGISIDKQAKSMLNKLCADLVSSAHSQAQVIVHRDYHSRNLMVIENKKLAVIDFQDAVIGPVTYDLVSLLKDCYVRLPTELVTSRALI